MHKSHMVIALATLVLATSPVKGAELPVSLDLTAIRALPVQHDGRWPPLDTAARDTVESITGDAFYQGHDPVLLLLAWTFDTPTWMRQPLISIRNAELRGELRLPATQTVFSYAELADHEHLHSLIDALAHIERGRKMNPLESKVSDINEKLIKLQQVFRGRVIRPIPDPNDLGGTWQAVERSGAAPSDDMARVQEAWQGLRAAFLADDRTAFDAASQQLIGVLGALPAAYRPDPQRIATELRYNSLNPFRAAWQIMVVGALLAAVAMSIRRAWFDGLAVVVMIAGFAVLTEGLRLRWEIAGRIPAANMFESLLFLSWGMGAFAILSVLFLRHRLVPLTASGMGALALVLADCLPMDHYVRPIVPVLMDTVWMSIHVPVIMVSYSVLALGVLIAHMQLVVMAIAPGRRRFIRTLDSLHYWYIHIGAILLLAGIVTGSMWAASSWGRYWGWDPKEVWSLIALLGYLIILHVRIDHEKLPHWAYVLGALLMVALFVLIVPKLAPLTGGKVLALGGAALVMVVLVAARGQFATAVKSVICFWLIIMTYVGVNYVLGIGLHSYGFGTGAVVRYLFWTGGIDLALIAICCVAYVFQRVWRSSADKGLPMATPV
ncbi:MAG: cytochrome c biogenesis protein CcsA [Phycisphaerales bacterium]|nr:MAG: cytochrome c biogenesis protein CcsA [Phycisphaerales bacterium]